MNKLKTTLAILALAMMSLNDAFAQTWSKDRHYVSQGSFTNEVPLNCYPAVSGDPTTLRQIATADGPRYQVTDNNGRYFSGTEWQTLFPNLGEGDSADDLEKLQSGTYYFDVEESATSVYFLAKSIDDEVLDFVLEVVID